MYKRQSGDKGIAKHVTGVFVVPDTAASEVVVYVDSSIMATELSMQSELLRLNLNIELNKDETPTRGMERKAEQVEKRTFRVSRDSYVARERKLTTNGRATAVRIAQALGVSERTVRRSFKKLRDYGFIERIGSDKAGYWSVTG